MNTPKLNINYKFSNIKNIVDILAAEIYALLGSVPHLISSNDACRDIEAMHIRVKNYYDNMNGNTRGTGIIYETLYRLLKTYLENIDKMDESSRTRTEVMIEKILERFKNSTQEIEPIDSEGVWPAEKKSMYLDELRRSFMEYSRGEHREGTQKSYDSILKNLISSIDNVKVSELDIRTIEKFLHKKKEEASPETAAKYYRSLKAIFEKAVTWGYLHENPIENIKEPKVPKKEAAYLTYEEYDELSKIITDNDFKDLVEVAVRTGMRSGELRYMRWEFVDFEKRIIKIRNTDEFKTKTGEIRDLPMNSTVYSILKKRSEISSGDIPYVFSRNGKVLDTGYISKEFKKYVRKAKLNDKLHFHSLRDTFTTWLSERGVTGDQIQKLLGHTSLVTTKGYQHLNTSSMHETVRKIAI